MFIDSRCNKEVVREAFPQTEFNSILLYSSLLKIEIVTGVEIAANGEWAISLPLNDGSVQSVCTLSVHKVLSPMDKHQFKHFLEDIKAYNPKIKKLKNLQVPEELGGEVDIILGIAHNNIYPEVILTLPNRLQILKSKFLPANKGDVCCIGGHIGSLSNIV